MKSLRCLMAVVALAFALPAQAGVNDPEVIIYRVSGVIDDGNVLATSFHCTNFSGATETIRVVTRSLVGALVRNVAGTAPHLSTAVLSTHHVFIYPDTDMATGGFAGTAAIAATSTNVTCTAMQVQTNVTNAVGVALHMTRFNLIAGTQE